MALGNDPAPIQLRSVGWRVECADPTLSVPPEGNETIEFPPATPGVDVFWNAFAKETDLETAVRERRFSLNPLNAGFLQGSFRTLRVKIWEQLKRINPTWPDDRITAKASLGSTFVTIQPSGLEARFAESWGEKGKTVSHKSAACHLNITVRWEALSAEDSQEILDLQRYGATIDNQDPSRLIRLLHRGIAVGNEEVARAALVVLQRLPVTPDRGRRFILREAIWATQALVREIEAQTNSPRFPDSNVYVAAVKATLDHLLTDTDRDGRPNFADYRDVWGWRIDTSKLSRL